MNRAAPRRTSIFALVLAASCLAVAGASQAARSAEKLFTLSSSAFKDDGILPAKYAGAAQCGGRNLSPPLAWSNLPAGTKSIAIVMIDPDGLRGIGSVHWLAYNIPASRTGLKAGQGGAPAKGITGGKNSRGTMLYTGPCASHAEAPHHYVIDAIALDLAPGFLQPGLDRDEFLKMITGHSLGPASLVVRYRRKS